MDSSRIKPSDLLNEQQLAIIRSKSDLKNVFALIFDWVLIVSSLTLFYLYPSFISFIVSVIIIGSRQFALAVLVHDGAHNLLFSDPKVNDFTSQWLCAYPIFQDNRVYRPYHLKHHRFTETKDDPDLSLSAPFPIKKDSFYRKIFRDLTGVTGYKRYSQALNSILNTEAKNSKEKLNNVWHKIHGFLI